MQTFLPYKSFSESAKCLDNKRLGKQRVEAWQIYCSLTQADYGWKNHPAVRMWRGYEKALLEYGYRVCREWISRGFNDSMKERFKVELFKFDKELVCEVPWLTDEFCRSHQSNLLRKDPVWYGQFKWNVPDNLPYVWPV